MRKFEHLLSDDSNYAYYAVSSGQLYKSTFHRKIGRVYLYYIYGLLDEELIEHINRGAISDISLYDERGSLLENISDYRRRLNISYNLEERYPPPQEKTLVLIDKPPSDGKVYLFGQYKSFYLDSKNPIDLFNSFSYNMKEIFYKRKSILYVSPETHAEFFNFAKDNDSIRDLPESNVKRVFKLNLKEENTNE